MPQWLPWLIAFITLEAFIALWFWEVNREMLSRKSTVESARAQLAASRSRAVAHPEGEEYAAVLTRSESIFQQSVDHYNELFQRPWIGFPGRLLGFSEEIND